MIFLEGRDCHTVPPFETCWSNISIWTRTPGYFCSNKSQAAILASAGKSCTCMSPNRTNSCKVDVQNHPWRASLDIPLQLPLTNLSMRWVEKYWVPVVNNWFMWMQFLQVSWGWKLWDGGSCSDDELHDIILQCHIILYLSTVCMCMCLYIL